MAQEAGCIALSMQTYIDEAVLYIKKEREYLVSELCKMNFEVQNSVTNYILIKKQDEGSDINWYNELLKYGILIRDCKDYLGLKEGFYRIAVRKHIENTYLIDCIRKILV